MILEALKFLSDLSRKADAPQPILTDDPRTARYVIQGELVRVDKAPRPRAHLVNSLDEVIAIANRFHEAGSTPVVWYDEKAVKVVFDDDTHRVETATLAFTVSDVFDRIQGLGDWLDQKAFVRLLRIDLGPRTIAPAVLLEPARRLEFENGEVRSGYVGRAEESLGRSIRSKVQSAAGDLPETVQLTTRVYSTAGEDGRHVIECAVEVEPGLAKLRLVPLPDEVDRVFQQAVASIRDRLLEGLAEGVPCYYGTP